MGNIERWVTVCPVHGVSFQAYVKPHDQGCYFWSTDDAHCREEVEFVRLTDDWGAVEERDELLTTLEAVIRDAEAAGHMPRIQHVATLTRYQEKKHE